MSNPINPFGLIGYGQPGGSGQTYYGPGAQLNGIDTGGGYGTAPRGPSSYSGRSLAAAQAAAPVASNPYADSDQANQQAILGNTGGYGQLTGQGGYYAGILNGTAPSLAQTQLQQATQQTLAAQQAAANSARGPLSGALAQRTAAQQGQATMLNEANQSVQARIQEEAMAAQGLGGALANQGQYALGVQGLNQGLGIENARLQAGQNQLNQQGALAWEGLNQQQEQNNIGQEQVGLADRGQQQQLSEYNSGVSNSFLSSITGGALGATGAALSSGGGGGGGSGGGGSGGGGGGGDGGGTPASDVKMREPGGGSALTLREEPFGLLLRNDRTGQLAKVATQPLSADEHRQAMAPHGAGPLIGNTPPPTRDPRTGYLYAGDLDVGGAGGDDAALMGAMQSAAGPADALGNYTPAADIPDGGIASVVPQASSSPGMNWGGIATGAARGLGSGAAAPGPGGITGLPGYADPASYGVQQHQADAGSSLMKAAGIVAALA